jgi:hypothetical protein
MLSVGFSSHVSRLLLAVGFLLEIDKCFPAILHQKLPGILVRLSVSGMLNKMNLAGLHGLLYAKASEFHNTKSVFCFFFLVMGYPGL